jgi:hypothetical protein
MLNKLKKNEVYSKIIMMIIIITITKMILISILTWFCDEEDAEMHKFSAIMV